MYVKYAESQGWKVEVMEAEESEAGGFSLISFNVIGDGVYGKLKYESGSHRVQRVPQTETQGRVHTSAATVMVLPEAEEFEEPEAEIYEQEEIIDEEQAEPEEAMDDEPVEEPTAEAVESVDEETASEEIELTAEETPEAGEAPEQPERPAVERDKAKVRALTREERENCTHPLSRADLPESS